MLDVYVPQSALTNVYTPGPQDGMSVSAVERNGLPYKSFACYSGLGVYGNIVPILRPVIIPSMGKIEPPHFVIPVRKTLTAQEQDLPVFFQIHAMTYRTEEEHCRISEIPSWT